jgi:hypothetical protein
LSLSQLEQALADEKTLRNLLSLTNYRDFPGKVSILARGVLSSLANL